MKVAITVSITISQIHSWRLRWGHYLLQAVQSFKLSHYQSVSVIKRKKVKKNKNLVFLNS